MKKQNRQKKWKVLVFCIWILFLAAASIGCIVLQRAMVIEKAKTELTNQAEIISRQFTSLVDTDFNARAVLGDRLISEAKAISFVLENYDDIDEANEFLEDIVNTTEVKNLWIYDRDGNVLFGSGDPPEETLEPDDISLLLDSKSYELIESNYNENEKYWTTTYILEDDSNSIVWGVKDRWLVYVEDIFSDTLKDVVQVFDWAGTRYFRTFRLAGTESCWLFQNSMALYFLIRILRPKGNRLKILISVFPGKKRVLVLTGFWKSSPIRVR